MSKRLDAKELIRALDVSVLATTCQITLANNCPSGWRVVIIAAGVKFFYDDGSDTTDGPRSVMLQSGQTATFVGKSAGCVQQFVLAMTVKAGDEDPQTMTYQDGVDPQHCLTHMTVALGPKSMIKKGARVENLAEQLELTKVT
jgi:hypothetical protein